MNLQIQERKFHEKCVVLMHNYQESLLTSNLLTYIVDYKLVKLIVNYSKSSILIAERLPNACLVLN